MSEPKRSKMTAYRVWAHHAPLGQNPRILASSSVAPMSKPRCCGAEAKAENKYFDTFEVVPEHPELGTSIVMGEDKVWTRITE